MRNAHRGGPRHRLSHSPSQLPSLLLASLLCLGPADRAQAINVAYQDPPGTNGADGTAPGGAGGDGQGWPTLKEVVYTSDPNYLMQLAGGAGGNGGNGAAGDGSVNGGAAGAGGSGAATEAFLTLDTAAPASTLQLDSAGGAGGNAGQPGAAGPGTLAGTGAPGGNGGDNAAFAIVSTVGSGSLTATVTSTGGLGGMGSGSALSGGGGNVDSRLTGPASGSAAMTLSATATGGAGGDTVSGSAGKGGNAGSEILLPDMGGALNLSLNSTAYGGNGGNAGLGGVYGAAGYARSTVSLASSTPPPMGNWNAVVNGSSTATAGTAGGGPGAPSGAQADASIALQGYGKVTGTAIANGGNGGDAGGYATAAATVRSNYIAIAQATANGGASFFNLGAGARADASAYGGWYAYAHAQGVSGFGREGGLDTAYANAHASVTHYGTEPASSSPLEARAEAFTTPGGLVQAVADFNDVGRHTSVTTTTSHDGSLHRSVPDVLSVANVGGPVYQVNYYGGLIPASSYASALVNGETAAVQELLARSPNVASAFADQRMLGVGNMGTMFFPSQNLSADFRMPFAAGSHLMLGLFSPSTLIGVDGVFDFSISNNGKTLYAASFNTADQARSFFTDHVLDLGAVYSSELDLLISMQLSTGAFAYNYVFGQGGTTAPVPEPQTWLMLAAGLALLLWQARGRRIR